MTLCFQTEASISLGSTSRALREGQCRQLRRQSPVLGDLQLGHGPFPLPVPGAGRAAPHSLGEEAVCFLEEAECGVKGQKVPG